MIKDSSLNVLSMLDRIGMFVPVRLRPKKGFASFDYAQDARGERILGKALPPVFFIDLFKSNSRLLNMQRL